MSLLMCKSQTAKSHQKLQADFTFQYPEGSWRVRAAEPTRPGGSAAMAAAARRGQVGRAGMCALILGDQSLDDWKCPMVGPYDFGPAGSFKVLRR